MPGMWLIVICQVILLMLELSQHLTGLAIVFVTVVIVMLAIANILRVKER